MTLEQWLNNGWLRSHKTSAQEIGNLLAKNPAETKETLWSTIISGVSQQIMRWSLLSL